MFVRTGSGKGMGNERMKEIKKLTREFGKGKMNKDMTSVDEKVRAQFKEYDDDNSGAIDAVEMRRILKTWGITGIDHNSMVEAFMRRDPKQAKGYSLNLLEFNDFIQFFNAVKEAFNAFTGVGYIQLNELKDFLSNFGYEFEPQALAQFLNIFDTDKSGSLEFNEIFNLILYLNRLEKFYSDADRDGSAQLDEGELQSLLRVLKINMTIDEMGVLLEMLPKEYVDNLNFQNFVKVLFFTKDNEETIKEKAGKLRAQNRKPRVRVEGSAAEGDTKRKIKEVSRRNAAVLDEMVRKCRQTKTKWEDPDFGPNNNCLFPLEPQRNAEIVRWDRPEKIAPNPALFCDGVDQGDVIQGNLGDCYLLSAFCVLATRGNEIEEVFTASFPDVGIYQCRFFKDGEWKLVTVDDRIPVNKWGQVLFGRCRDPNEMWTSLMEKAYAKLHGNYGAIESGDVAEALVDLTGEPGEIMMDMNDSDEIWEKMLYYHDEGYLMGCAAEVEGDHVEVKTPEGLLLNHAYGILHVEEVNGHKLLRLRNPWGSYEWNGPWSDGSKEWTEEMISYFDTEFGDDGTFWMEFHDWAEHFTRAVIVRILGAKWDKKPIAGEWRLPDNAGGSLNHQSWSKNPQYKLRVPNACEVFISLSWEDLRYREKKIMTYPSCGVTVIKRLKDGDTKQKSIESRAEIAAISLFIKCRFASMAFQAEANQSYTVILSAFDPNVEGKWTGLIATKGRGNVEELKASLPSSSVKGEWKGITAAGCPDWNSWHNGPQYILSVAEPVETDITILQSRNERNELGHIGFHLFKAEREKRKVHDSAKEKKLFVGKYQNASTVTHKVKLESGEYNIVPATFTPGWQTSFGVLVQGYGCHLKAIQEDWYETRASGRWRGPHLWGGCHNDGNPDFKKNPRYSFHLNQFQVSNFVLQIPQNSDVKGIGYYIFEYNPANRTIGNRVYASGFTTEREICKRVECGPGDFAIMPTTYKKNIEEAFEIICYGLTNTQLTSLDI